MSLINQMLKDLEARRGPQANGYVLDHPLPSQASTDSRWPRYLLGALLVLMALGLGWLLSERLLQAAPAPSAQQSPASQAEVSIRNSLETDALSRPEPPASQSLTATEQQSPPVASPRVQAAPISQIPVSQTSAPPSPAPEPIATEPTQSRPVNNPPPADSVQLERRIRPPSPQQLAEQAYQQGYLLLQRGQASEGEAQWQQALQHEPAHLASREGLAGLYLSQGRQTEAQAVLEIARQHHPGHGQFALMLARIRLEQQDLLAAIAVLEDGLRVQAQRADYLAFLAALYQRQQAYDRSIAAYQQALSQQAEQASWWMGLGISMEGAGRPNEASQAYREALERGGLSRPLQDYVQQRLRALR